MENRILAYILSSSVIMFVTFICSIGKGPGKVMDTICSFLTFHFGVKQCCPSTPGAGCLVFQLWTPSGLTSSSKIIVVKKILLIDYNSFVPEKWTLLSRILNLKSCSSIICNWDTLFFSYLSLNCSYFLIINFESFIFVG